MKKNFFKRAFAVLLTVCLLLTALPLSAPIMDVEAVGGVNSLTCSGFISNSTARNYIDKMMRYYINSSSTLQSTLNNGNSVVFMFEGGSDNYWNGTTYYNGAYNTRTQAVCIVVKMNSSGNAYIDYYCENSSSIPSEPTWCTNGVAYSGSCTLMDGIYSFFTWNHTGPYAAFQINLTNSDGYCYYTPSNNMNGYKAGASGINIHTRSTSYGGGSSLGWAWSEGCQVIGYGNDSSNEFNGFMKSVTGITWNPWISWSNKTLNTWTNAQLYSYEGYYVVDRQLALSNPSGTKYGSGSLGSLYNQTALTNITANSTAAKNAAGAGTVDYMSQCTEYPAYGTLTCTGTDVWCRTLPCYADVDSSTVAISSYNIGDTLTCTGLYKNSIGEYWYEVISRSGTTAYVRAAYMDFTSQNLSDITLTGHTKPNGHVQGTGFVVDGTISSTYNQLTAVSAYIHDGLGTKGETETGHRVTVSSNKYILEGSAVDNNTWMNVMGNGPHTMAITAEYKNCYVENDTTLKTNTGKILLAEDYFMVIPSSVSQSSCSHTYQNYPVDGASTSCTVASKTVKGCTTCGLMGSVTTTTGSHSFGSWVTTAATCTQAGSKVRTCTACGTKETQTIEATGHNYVSVYHKANCSEYAKTVYTCSSCNDSYTVTQGPSTSEWSETKPEGIDESLIETKTQYRYSEYEQVKNYEPSMEGYTLFSKEWEQSKTGTVYYVPSWPSGFDKTSSIYNEYNGTKKTASENYYTKTEIDSDSLAGYLYYHWCHNGSYYSYSSKQGNYTTFHAYYATANPNNYECDTSDMSYKTSNTACCTNSDWYFVANVYAQKYTEYKALYTHSRWAPWSEWSDTEYTDDWNTDVETRTLYRYTTGGEFGDHVYENGYCSVCGEKEPNNGLYLFGYINGADYGCNDDSENTGVYKFVDGKLTATFTETSYVAVKRGDNSAFYMTDGYPGDDAASATLYNTTASIDSNKLRVPKGREITFTLIDNGDDTFTLSYVAAACAHRSHDLSGVCASCGETVEHIFAQGACKVCGKPCKHTWKNGACAICGFNCLHSFNEGECITCHSKCEHNFENGKCTICKTVCEHSFVDGACTNCGAVCEHSFFDGACIVCGKACTHTWENGTCTLCSAECIHNFSNGDCTNCHVPCDHTWEDGRCTICSLYCEHNFFEGACTICGKSCNHTWENSTCTTCNLVCEHNFEDGVCLICSFTCEHSFSEGGCTTCGKPCEHNFEDEKCTVCGANCDHKWEDSTCTDCGKVCSTHSYVNGFCAVCGKEEPEYYLFGYINGEDYGCEGDYLNTGVYKFKNGRLKTIFTKDSYVAVKTGDNAEWYMTDGYLGKETTSATLYNTKTSINADKLFVPGGRLVTFTLVNNGDDTYTLSYVAEACSHAVHNTSGVCLTCSETVDHSYSDGRCTVCGVSCNHSFEEGECTVCNKVCAHKWVDGTCSVCKMVCEHEFQDGLCVNCGFNCIHSFKDDTCENCGAVCSHTWKDGTCSECGKACEHNFTDGECSICSKVCSHEFDGDTCKHCATTCGHTWNNGACTNCGVVCDHTWESGKCSVCGTVCDHNVSGDSCAICGQNYKYYLVGNIDGENVGCEENFELLGDNVFVNGTLSMTVNKDSYVFVKTQDNENWYFTDGTDGREATLYNINNENATGMMFIPAGVKATFTLSYNNDGTLNLSYVIFECNHNVHSVDGSCTACDDTVSHEYVNGECEVCGHKEALPEIAAKYVEVLVEEEIIYNVVFSVNNFEASDEMGLLVFSSNNPQGTITDAAEVINDVTVVNGKYTAKTKSIHPKNLGDTVYMKVYSKLSDGNYIYSDIISYNAVRYAENVLRNPNSSAEKKAFMVALLNYAAEAQMYFDYNTDNLANARLTAKQKALVQNYSEDMATAVTAVDRNKLGDFSKSGKTALLYPTASFDDNLFSINYNFKTNGKVDSEVILYYWDAHAYAGADVLTAENASGTVTMTLSENGTYCANIDGISAKNMDETIYVAAVYENNGDRSCSGIVAYSLTEYLKVYAENASSDMQALAESAIVYGYYAKNYFAK